MSLPKDRPSSIIKERLLKAKKRFYANDNIADFINDDEIALLENELTEKLEGVLDTLIIDRENDHNTQESARRVARMYLHEVFRGRFFAAPKATEFPNATGTSGLMTVGPIRIRSACSHHLCPIIGDAWVGVIPNPKNSVLGLSKYARLVDWVMARPQIQEEAIEQVADVLEEKTKPLGLMVFMKASHSCMQWRGVKEDNAQMGSVVTRGVFNENTALRQEFFNIIGS